MTSEQLGAVGPAGRRRQATPHVEALFIALVSLFCALFWAAVSCRLLLST
ncbi:MAG TPA: hypothetical protein VGP57_03265 [Actinoplanes sp.]|nr:hypothetical protein [Actinoplanes sp.]